MPRSLRNLRAPKFAHKYTANGFNAGQAVLDIGWTTNPDSAYVIGHRLLRTVKAQQIINKHMESAKADADEVLSNLTRIARTEVKFTGSDVVKANELLGKGHKLFTDRVESENINHNDSTDLPAEYVKLAAKQGINLTYEQAEARIAEQFAQPQENQQDTSREAEM